jgi:hypothetical protein
MVSLYDHNIMTGYLCCAFIDYQINNVFADLITTANTNMIDSTTSETTIDSTTHKKTTESTSPQKPGSTAPQITPPSITTESTSTPQTSTEPTTPQTTTGSTTTQTTTGSTTPQTTTESTTTPITTHSTITTGLPGPYGEKQFENKVVVITVGIAGSVIGILFICSVITIITLKYRKRNDAREKGNSQNEDAFSDLPNWVKFFDNNRPTLYRGSLTSYPAKPFQSESKGRDKRMFNYRV